MPLDNFLHQLWSFVCINIFKHSLVLENVNVNVITLKVLSPLPFEIIPCDYFSKFLNSDHMQFVHVNVHLV